MAENLLKKPYEASQPELVACLIDAAERLKTLEGAASRVEVGDVVVVVDTSEVVYSADRIGVVSGVYKKSALHHYTGNGPERVVYLVGMGSREVIWKNPSLVLIRSGHLNEREASVRDNCHCSEHP